jgi:PucR C-terminal helix-turn-helix domain
MAAVPTIVEASVATIRNRGGDVGVEGGTLERNLRHGIADAVERWFDGEPSERLDLHFAFGRAQARAGRSLDEMLAVYRAAGQKAWRALTRVGTEQAVPPADLYQLAELGFACLDEISTQAAAGFTEEDAHRSGAARSRRSELVQVLLEEPPPAAEVLARAAAEAGVTLGESIACFAGPAEDQDSFARAARDSFPLVRRGSAFAGLLLDPGAPGRRATLAATAARVGVTIALGPALAPAQAALSMRRALALLELDREGLLPPHARLLLAEEHGVELLLSADRPLAREVCARLLAPLQEVTSVSMRASLAATLEAWLRTPGQRKAVAHALGVHPQTVRYRMGRLRELFGEALEDPGRRFELALALRLRRVSEADAQSSGVVYAALRPPSTRNVEAVT